jgi:hypothetical protein
MNAMASQPSSPSGGAGHLWRQTLGLLRDRLERQGLEPNAAEELGEAVIIVCALRHQPMSLEQAMSLAWTEVMQQRPW